MLPSNVVECAVQERRRREDAERQAQEQIAMLRREIDALRHKPVSTHCLSLAGGGGGTHIYIYMH